MNPNILHEPEVTDEIPVATEQLDNENQPEDLDHVEAEAAKPSVPELLGSISIKETVDLDWELARSIIREDSIEFARQQVNRWAELTPAVASAIIHEHDPSQELLLPKPEDIKKHSRGLKLVSRVLDFISPKLSARFDNYLVKKASRHIFRIARRTVAVFEAVGSFNTPREDFLEEVQHLHKDLLEADNSHPEENIQELMRRMFRLKFANAEPIDHWYNQENYPLLTKLLPMAAFPSSEIASRRRTIKFVAPEIMQGIERFLKKQEIQTTAETIPFPSLTRTIAQKVRKQRIQSLPEEIEAMLTKAYRILPEDGDKFTSSIYGLCQKVVDLAKAGEDPRVITRQIFKDLW